MIDNEERKKLLDKVKSSLPGVLRVITSTSPAVRALGLVVAGGVWVIALAFPGVLDGDTVRAVLSAFGV